MRVRPIVVIMLIRGLAKLGGKVTRVPITDQNGVVRYIVHQSGLFRFLAQQQPVHFGRH